MSELENIELLVTEARKLWMQSPQFVSSEQFFRLWQENCKPLPFIVSEPEIVIAGQTLNVEARAGRKKDDAPIDWIAYVTWDDYESCPLFVLENGYDAVTFLLRIGEAGIEFEPGPDLSNPLEDNLRGEHVEAMFEVAKILKERYPMLDLSKAKDAVVKAVLSELASRADGEVFNKILKSKAAARARLMKQVTSDMAEDEFSAQLTLGLTFDEPMTSQEPQDDDRPIEPCTFAARGKWEIQQDVDLLLEAEKERLKCETSFVFNFGNAVLLSPLENAHQIVKLTCTPEMMENLHEGAKFFLFAAGAPRVFLGAFQLEICDNPQIIGTISWNSPEEVIPVDENLCAMPRKSPQEYLTRALEELRKTLFNTSMDGLDAMRGTLGMSEVKYLFPPPERNVDYPHLDGWQACAVSSCLDERNPIVLVQGPPGTGKTSVLEVVIRELAKRHASILVTAPSNTAVDNICRRVMDLPLLRHSSQKEAIASEIAENFWSGDGKACAVFLKKVEAQHCEIHAGTHIGILRSSYIANHVEKRSAFDAIIFDEAGMSRTGETLLCLCLAKRAFFFGDPQQLPPFPLQESVWEKLRAAHPVMTKSQEDFIGSGLLTWLQIHRHFPAILLRTCYRCRNPRLMRFASLLFYNALVKSDPGGEYFKLSFKERQQMYSPKSLRFISTSQLPEDLRHETLKLDGFQPGYENLAEAKICVKIILDNIKKYPMHEITLISPYKKQVKLIRQILKSCPHPCDDEAWHSFRHERIATVDSFQGGESDLVIISYVRSGGSGIGFVDDPNRINVTHTRSRREMVVVGDLDFLMEHANSKIFLRMARNITRDGVIEAPSLVEFNSEYGSIEIPEMQNEFA